jgi:hypothetical protein
LGNKFRKFLLVIIIFYSFSSVSFSQKQIIGAVKDSTGDFVANANIQILDKITNKVLNFQSTKSNGAFAFVLSSSNENLKLKITHLSYETRNIEFTIKENVVDLGQIVLNSKATILKSVIINKRFNEVVEVNDTIRYNLKKLLNGSEEKLKDIIAKLPGLNIDENGKIKFNGVQIDDLLIDGDELYNNQHQLATENLKSEMIEKIEVLKDFKSFSSLGELDGTKKTALNVSIKEEFKNKINGVIDLEGGYKNRYKSHNYIFNFNKNTKASLIADTNNLNSLVLNVNDYLELKSISNREINSLDSNNSLTVNSDVPEFLFAEDDVVNKTIRNITFNINNKLSKNSRLQAYSVFNNVNQLQQINAEQVFIADTNSKLLKQDRVNSNSIFSSSYIKFENKLSKKSSVDYTLSLNYSNNNQNNIIDNFYNGESTNLNQNKIIEDFNFGQNFNFKKVFNNKSKIDFILYNEISNANNIISLNSSNPFLNLNFISNNFEINQYTNQKRIKLGTKFKYNLKDDKNTYSFQIGSSLLNETLDNSLNENNPTFNFVIKSNFFNNYFGGSFSREFSGFFKFSVGNDFNINASQFDGFSDSSNFVVLPFTSLNFTISQKMRCSLSYKRSLSSFTLNQFIKGNVINDYITTQRNNFLLNNNFLLANHISFNASYSDFTKNFNSNLNLVFSQNNKSIGTNSSIENNISFVNNQLINKDNSAYLVFIADKKLRNLPLSLNFQVVSSLIQKQNFTNFVSNQFELLNNRFEFTLTSFFKNNDFNFNAGILYTSSNSINSLLRLVNKFEKITPSINFNGLILNDKLNWSIRTNYFIFKTTNFSIDNILDITPKLTYNTSKWDYFISGGNILNIRENNIKAKSFNSDILIEQSFFNSLSGFVNIGTSFSF